MKYALLLIILALCLLTAYLVWKLLKKAIFWIFILIIAALTFLLFYSR
jgi:hypothetical protein